MTRLLVSVRDADEALDAVAGGADLIDIKEPNAGSLGAASPDVVAQILEAVGKRRPVSVALGELESLSCDDFSYCAGAVYAKVGLAHAAGDPNWRRRWQELIDRLPTGVRPVAVIYADHASCGAPTPRAIITQACQFGCAAVLIDTFDKTRGRLTEQWSIDSLRELSNSVRQANMLLVVAGSLAIADIPVLLPLSADYIAVRSAVCQSRRTARLSRQLVQEFSRDIKIQLATVSFEIKDTAQGESVMNTAQIRASRAREEKPGNSSLARRASTTE